MAFADPHDVDYDAHDRERLGPEPPKRVDAVALLVEPGGQPDPVGKDQAHALDRLFARHRFLQQTKQVERLGKAQAVERDVVGALRVEAEQQVTGKFVNSRGHGRQ